MTGRSDPPGADPPGPPGLSLVSNQDSPHSQRGKRRGRYPASPGPFPNRLGELRHALQLTQAQIAAQSGITLPTYSTLEQGRRKLLPSEEGALVRVLGCGTPSNLYADGVRPSPARTTRAARTEAANPDMRLIAAVLGLPKRRKALALRILEVLTNVPD